MNIPLGRNTLRINDLPYGNTLIPKKSDPPTGIPKKVMTPSNLPTPQVIINERSVMEICLYYYTLQKSSHLSMNSIVEKVASR